MSDNNIEIKLGADASQAKTELSNSISFIKSKLNELSQNFAALGVSSKSEFDGISKNIKKSADEVKNSLDKISQSSTQVKNNFQNNLSFMQSNSGSAFASITSNIKQFAAAYAGIEAIKVFTKLSDEMALYSQRLQSALKDTDDFVYAQKKIYEIAQQNQVALTDVGKLFTRLSRPVQELGGNVKQTAAIVESFSILLRLSGGSAEEANSALLQFSQAMGKSVLNGDEFRSLAENFPKFMNLLSDSLGKSTGELMKMSEQGKLTSEIIANVLIQSLKDLREEAKSMPGTFGGTFQQIKNDVAVALDEFNKHSGFADQIILTLKMVWDYFKNLIDVASSVNDYFATTLANIFGTTASKINVLSLALASVASVINIGFTAAEIVTVSLYMTIKTLIAVWEMLIKVVTFNNPVEAVKKYFKEIDQIALETKTRIQNITNSFNQNQIKIQATYDTSIKKQESTKKTDEKVDILTGKTQPEKEKNDKSRTPQWEEELARQKVFFMKSNDLYQMSLQQEKNYWDGKLATLNKGDKEYIEIRKKSSDLEMQILKKQADIKKEMELSDIDSAKRTALNGIEFAEEEAQFKLNLGSITHQQLLEKEKEFEEKKYIINKKALEQRLLLMEKDPNLNPLEAKKIKEQLLEMEQQYLLKKKKIDNASELDSNQKYKSMFASINTGFASVIKQFMQGSLTVKGLFQGMADAVLGAIIEMLAKVAAELLISFIMQKILGTTTAVTGIGANAALAASAAFASTAAIPVVGPGLAPAAAKAAYAGTIAYAAAVPAALNGYDIPAGVNPLTQLHEKEMVLPAKYADVIRGMEESGGSSGQSPVNITINAVDAKSVRDYFKQNSHSLAPALRQMARNFNAVKV